MSRQEFLEWVRFQRDFPFDDVHRYQRPAAYIAWRFAGGRFDEHIEGLVPPVPPDGMTLADFNTLRAFGEDPYEEMT